MTGSAPADHDRRRDDADAAGKTLGRRREEGAAAAAKTRYGSKRRPRRGGRARLDGAQRKAEPLRRRAERMNIGELRRLTARRLPATGERRDLERGVLRAAGSGRRRPSARGGGAVARGAALVARAARVNHTGDVLRDLLREEGVRGRRPCPAARPSATTRRTRTPSSMSRTGLALGPASPSAPGVARLG